MSRVFHCETGRQLQAALNVAVSGDSIELNEGQTYYGNFIIPKRSLLQRLRLWWYRSLITIGVKP
jgi:hypothetical protein